MTTLGRLAGLALAATVLITACSEDSADEASTDEAATSETPQDQTSSTTATTNSATSATSPSTAPATTGAVTEPGSDGGGEPTQPSPDPTSLDVPASGGATPGGQLTPEAAIASFFADRDATYTGDCTSPRAEVGICSRRLPNGNWVVGPKGSDLGVELVLTNLDDGTWLVTEVVGEDG